MKASPSVTRCNCSITACGLMTVSEVGYLRQSRPRHSAICFHQPCKALVLVCTLPASSCDSSSTSTSLTLPTIGMSTRTRFEIDEGSMSMWMILRGFEAKCFGLPITRSSKREPMAIRTSQCCIAMFAS